MNEPALSSRRLHSADQPNHVGSAQSSLSAAFGRLLGALLLPTLALSCPTAAFAEKADRNKPTQVESDRMHYDDLNQVNIFIGNVILTKGSIVLRADRLELKQDAQGYQHGVAYGKPAFFRQKRDGLDEFIEATGDKLDYDGKQEVLKVDKNAHLKRLAQEKLMDEVRGSLVVYDAKTEFYSVEGGSGAATANNPGGRVRVTIQPKDTAADAAPAALPLKPDAKVVAPR